MIYLLVFIICVLMHEIKKINYAVYIFAIVFVFTILCFGYTCGSDWRNYEILYYKTNALDRYSISEFGFTIWFKLCNLLEIDFWIVNGISKVFFLWSLFKFFNFFTKRPWMCVGLSFAFKTLFMIIDCPMRFMLGMAFCLFATIYFVKGKLYRFLLFIFLGTIFHNSILLIGFLINVLRYSTYICKIRPISLSIMAIVCSFVGNFSEIYEYLFNGIDFIFNKLGVTDNRILFYSFFSNSKVFSIETIWHFGCLLLILYNKKIILLHKYGSSIYAGSWLYFCFGALLNPLPTSFRLSILFGYLFVISLGYIVINKISTLYLNCRTLSVSIIIWLMLIVVKDVYSLPAYYPYTNSLPYIVKGHLPYSYRSNYNYIEFKKTFGYLPEKREKGTNLYEND